MIWTRKVSKRCSCTIKSHHRHSRATLSSLMVRKRLHEGEVRNPPIIRRCRSACRTFCSSLFWTDRSTSISSKKLCFHWFEISFAATHGDLRSCTSTTQRQVTSNSNCRQKRWFRTLDFISKWSFLCNLNRLQQQIHRIQGAVHVRQRTNTALSFNNEVQSFRWRPKVRGYICYYFESFTFCTNSYSKWCTTIDTEYALSGCLHTASIHSRTALSCSISLVCDDAT